MFWEYRVDSAPPGEASAFVIVTEEQKPEAVLNRMHAEAGWEYVGAIPYPNTGYTTWRYVYRRPAGWADSDDSPTHRQTER